MVRNLLLRGMLAGVLAGLLAFGFGKVFGEPQVDRAIAFEEQMSQSMGDAPEMELVSRQVQASIGLFTAVVVYGAAFGGLFALVFAYCYGRVGSFSPRVTAALLALAAFVTIVLVPDIKYPANPPSVGNPDTIGFRTLVFFTMIVVAIAAMSFSVSVGRRLAARHGKWNASLMGGAVFLAIVVVAQLLLPAINEVPEHFPATTLWSFRIASLGMEAILWTTIGLVFGALAEPVLLKRRTFTQPAYR